MHYSEKKAPTPASPQSQDRSAQLLLLLALLLLLGVRVVLLPRRFIDPDELEHAHAAWRLFKGELPYKDFFEHHTPWYYYFLRPFFRWFEVDSSFESARHFLLFGRALSLLLSLGSLGLIFWLGRLWKSARIGLLAALLLAAQTLFLHKCIEMRPDMLAMPFFLASLCLLLRGLERASSPSGKPLGFFLGAGLCLGGATMCTQKMLFVLPGLGTALGLWALFPHGGPAGASAPAQSFPRRVLFVSVFLAAFVLPGILTWAYLSAHDGGREFIANNFLLNSKWKHVVTGRFRKLVETSWPTFLATLLGISVFVRGYLRGQRDVPGLLLLATMVGLFVGARLIPTAQGQYYLMPLPLACLFAATGLAFLVEQYPLRWRRSLLVVTVVLLALRPISGIRENWGLRNDAQLARLREVFEKTAPTDVVMDGWEGTGVFRPHAFYYYFIHQELLPMLPPAHVETYLAALESGEVRPKMIALDKNLEALGPRFVAFVKRHYESRDGFLYFSTSQSPSENR